MNDNNSKKTSDAEPEQVEKSAGVSRYSPEHLAELKAKARDSGRLTVNFETRAKLDIKRASPKDTGKTSR
ncbi:hypothetical protein [Yoonia sp.]|uniref:hypothetical protein n=1 Tax=Yoonia sp. TaxID=2212373 RepID=UPI00358E120F